MGGSRPSRSQKWAATLGAGGIRTEETFTMLSILNNISSLQAENALNSTQASLNSTLQQLSTGQRINSGADDPAGLAIANGLSANIAALNQSIQNANNGVGNLQVADG